MRHALVALSLLAGHAAAQCGEQRLPGGLFAFDPDFGVAAAVEADLAVVGVPLAGSFAEVPSVLVYERSGSVWAQVARLVPSDHDFQGDWRYGAAVAIGDGRIAVGSPRKTVGGGLFVGQVYVYERLGTGWIEAARIPGTFVGGRFGDSLALEDRTLLVGAPQESHFGFAAGVVYCLEETPGGWLVVQRITEPTSGAGHEFATVAMSGDVAWIGAPGADAPGVRDAGAVYVHERAAGVWTPVQTLHSSTPAAGGEFGRRVELSDGVGIVATPLSGHVFGPRPTGWVLERVLNGRDFGLHGETLAALTSVVSGRVSIHERGGGSWPRTALSRRHGPFAGTPLGSGARVALHGESLLLTAPGESAFGVAYFFHPIERALGSAYCPSTVNSTGRAAVLSAQGLAHVSGGCARLWALGLPGTQPTQLLASTSAGFLPGLGGGAGVLCIGLPLHRIGPVVDSSFVLEHELDLHMPPPGVLWLPGDTWHFQLWFRDPPAVSNTTNGVAITLR